MELGDGREAKTVAAAVRRSKRSSCCPWRKELGWLLVAVVGKRKRSRLLLLGGLLRWFSRAADGP